MTHPLLEVKQLSKYFRLGNQLIPAVHKVSFTLASGEILGIGGESGSGKSTLAKLLMSLLQPTEGEILFNRQPISPFSHRRDIQMIFQHPASSINPRWTVEKTLAEPLILQNLAKGKERQERILELLHQVGLSSTYLKRLPHELSGGQKQRIAIARALAVDPRLLICDEPFSALDISTQMYIIDLLQKLHEEKSLAYIIISHDLSVLRYFTHRLAVMYLGKLMEWGPTQLIYEKPLHPYTQALLSSVLSSDPFKERQRQHVAIKGEIPSQLTPIQGCPFYSRCPLALPICQTTPPPIEEIKTDHFVTCHRIKK